MSRIDERLEVMKVDTAEMTKEQKFSAATGLTFYDEELAGNEWYVPGGAANVNTEAASTEEEKTPVESTDVPEQTDENVTDPVAEPTETTESTDEPVTDPVAEPTDEPVTEPVVEPTDVTEQTETTESTDEPVTDPVVDPTPSEIEIETQP